MDTSLSKLDNYIFQKFLLDEDATRDDDPSYYDEVELDFYGDKFFAEPRIITEEI